MTLVRFSAFQQAMKFYVVQYWHCHFSCEAKISKETQQKVGLPRQVHLRGDLGTDP